MSKMQVCPRPKRGALGSRLLSSNYYESDAGRRSERPIDSYEPRQCHIISTSFDIPYPA